MKEITFVKGYKEEIPTKYLNNLLQLFQENHKEIYLENPPTREYFEKYWVFPFVPEIKRKYVLAIDSEEKIIGYSYLQWRIKYDNLDKGYFWTYITRNERRKGYGTRLVRELVKEIPAQITKITTDAFLDTPGYFFIENFGKEKSYQEIISIADLTKFNRKKVSQTAKTLRKNANKRGYEFLFIKNLKHSLFLNFKKFVKMVESIWNDMPVEELSYDKEELPLERYQRGLERRINLGNEVLTFVVLEKQTNNPIGMTCTFVNKFQPHIAIQDDTGILHQHRGYNLGLTLKYQMLEKLLEETDAKIWRTGNAQSNKHMLRINEKLQHQPFQRINVYEYESEVFTELV
ncbi:MAG: GNAT family N-acetyltransferase [Asgard group archaeon]|nr:GNAT family N-acetyltransferase [Asgard group archaeon]